MAPNNPIEQLFSKILTVSQSAYQIPQATRNDQIYLQFNSPPTISDDEEDEGMWLVVNKKMDSLFGVENCKQNLRRGNFGIKLVIEYLKKARDHPLWNADKLLALKLECIYRALVKRLPGSGVATPATAAT